MALRRSARRLGVWFYTAAVEVRGARPKPFPTLLVAGPERQGGARLERLSLSLRPQPGRARQFRPRRPVLPRCDAAASRRSPDYPYDFLYCESTHPVRVNKRQRPDPRMPEFVKRWNSEDPFKFRFVTTTEFGTILRDGHGNAIGAAPWSSTTIGPMVRARVPTRDRRQSRHRHPRRRRSDRGLATRAAATDHGAPPARRRPMKTPPSSTSAPGVHSSVEAPQLAVSPGTVEPQVRLCLCRRHGGP